MTTTWQLSLGPNDWDFIHSVRGDLFSFPRGLAKMIVFPSVGDTVLVTCRAKLVMMARIHVAFHMHPVALSEMATMRIVERYLHPIHLKGMRRNWTRLH